MAAPATKATGKVKWFNSQKGFGFITPDDGQEDIFVHQSTIYAQGFRSLDENEEVEYDLEQGSDGRLKAVNVTGPNGDYVKGAPRQTGGYGGGGGGGGYGGGYGGYGDRGGGGGYAERPRYDDRYDGGGYGGGYGAERGGYDDRSGYGADRGYSAPSRAGPYDRPADSRGR
mmetsp:Transcript_39481/g.100896  ORF Transcript_39481/g.100896 Transcript_39481/m.100896 type:complete len:171 (-) Transcript_39481:150-662(-)